MRVTSVNYKKIFPGEIQFTNTTLGLEIEVNENENASDAFDLAKKTVEEWMNPPKATGQHTHEDSPITAMNGFALELQKARFKEPLPEINRNDEKIEIAIDNAQTLEELNALSKNLPTHLWIQFNDKLSKLKNK